MLSLVLIIIFGVLFIFSILVLVLLYIKNEKKRVLEKGIRIYKYSPETRMVVSKELKKFRYLFRFRHEQYGSEEKQIDDELSFIFGSPGEKLLRQALHNCAKRIPKSDFAFTSKIEEFKNQEFDIKMTFNLTEDNQYIITLS